MKRAVLAGAIVMTLALPAGWAGAKVAGPVTSATRPKAHVGRTHKAVKVGQTTASVKTRKTKAKVRAPKGKATKVTTKGAKTSTGSVVGLGNPAVGDLRVGTRKRPNGRLRLRLGGNLGGAPIRTGLGL